MHHNLFSHPSEATVLIDDKGYHFTNLDEAEDILEILDNLEYDPATVLKQLETRIAESEFMTKEGNRDTLSTLKHFLAQNGYLRTTK